MLFLSVAQHHQKLGAAASQGDGQKAVVAVSWLFAQIKKTRTVSNWSRPNPLHVHMIIVSWMAPRGNVSWGGHMMCPHFVSLSCSCTKRGSFERRCVPHACCGLQLWLLPGYDTHAKAHVMIIILIAKATASGNPHEWMQSCLDPFWVTATLQSCCSLLQWSWAMLSQAISPC